MDAATLNPDFWLAIFIAIVSGGLIGVERQIRGKAAGIRTGILISLGTMLFVYMGAHLEGLSVDGSRVLGQVVTGIGFIGAGVMFNKGGTISGVTTAAVIWLMAAIGSMAGLGYTLTPIMLSLLVVVILRTCTSLENNFAWLQRGDYKDESKQDG